MPIINPLSTVNAEISISSNQGPINIGTDAAQKVITVGNITGTTSLVFNSGTGGIAQNSSGAFTLDSTGVLELNSSGAAISIGNDNVAQNINIGTAGARTLTIGNAGATAALNLNSTDQVNVNGGTFNVTSGSGGVFIDASGVIELNSSGAAIHIGNDAVNQNITIGAAGSRTINIGHASATALNFAATAINIPAFNQFGAIATDGSGTLSSVAVSDAGKVLTSNGPGAAPTFQAIPSASYITWAISTASQAMTVNTGYIVQSGFSCALTLPASAAVGDRLAIQGGGNLWTLSQNAGQVIHFPGGSTTTGVSGSVASSTNFDSLYLVCVATNNWAYTGGFGNYNVV